MRRTATGGLLLAWSGVAAMWGVWTALIVFLSNPRVLQGIWPLPMIDVGTSVGPELAILIDVGLVALFGLQHSLMARPWFKARIRQLPEPHQRCLFVHAANFALLVLVLFWQPIPDPVWNLPWRPVQTAVWALFALGWFILLFGAASYGILDLLGVPQMQAWARGEEVTRRELKTGLLYRWLRHPMYVGVLLGFWATPTMSLGHLLLAVGMTVYVLIAVRYEERDLRRLHGKAYDDWQAAPSPLAKMAKGTTARA